MVDNIFNNKQNDRQMLKPIIDSAHCDTFKVAGRLTMLK